MKRLALILGAAALATVSAPASARAQTGCSWWDLTCNGLATRVVDYGWHMRGRDQNGNVVYLRRRVDSNGNVIIEQARRSAYGQYLVLNNHVIRKGTVYGANGELCKYDENNNGYKEECKYAKGTRVSGVRYPSNRFGVNGASDCKYESNRDGYKEECKYDKVHPAKVKPVKYEAPRHEAPKYEPPKHEPPKTIHYDNDVKGAKPHKVDYHATKIEGAKGHEGKDVLKDKGPKH